MQRKCWKCKTEKPFEEFGKRSSDKFGIDKICKICRRERDRDFERRNREARVARHAKWRDENREDINKRNRERYAQNPAAYLQKQKTYRYKYKEKLQEYAANYREKNKFKCNARKIFQYHCQKGNIKKPNNCSLCGRNNCRLDGHHYDYSKPLEVVWVCCYCHLAIHRHIKRVERTPNRINEVSAVKDARVFNKYKEKHDNSETKPSKTIPGQ